MSVPGHFRKSDSVRDRSAHPPTTDIERLDRHVGFVPSAEVGSNRDLR